jgi:hypothetical protein
MKPDRTMTVVLGMEHIGEAFMKLRDMNLGQREQLADEVHAAQPNLFYSVLVLNRYGASFVQLEVVLNILFVFYLAMKATGRNWQLISEAIQERCLTRLTGRIRFIEGLTPEQQGEVVSSAMADHSEPWMLAFAFGELRENGMLGITTDAEKYLVLAALNLVECVAEVARA